MDAVPVDHRENGTADGSKYDVCTNGYYNQHKNVGDWKIHRA
ncbi:hypothetical protein ACFYMI_26015 [Streptomyces collinus]